MRQGLIITLPRWDNVTEYLSQFSDEILKTADEQGIKYKALKDKFATKKEFEKVLNGLDYNFLVFNGHGSEESIKGQDNEIIVQKGDNEHILKDRIVYARACEAGAVLGEEAVKTSHDGCFIGYEHKFIFWADKSWDSVPLKDETAKLFLEPSNMAPISILKGHSTGEAHETAKKYTLKSIRRVLRNPTNESFWLASALWTNYNGQVIHGDSAATI